LGRPYSTDITALSETFKWALSVKLPDLQRAVAAAAEFPMVYVGSGGSYTGGILASQLHWQMARKVSRVLTPLEAGAHGDWSNTAVILLSAGGNNPDVLGIFNYLLAAEPAVLGVICSRVGSKLSSRAQGFEHVEFIEAEPPIGKDGFLATNSLLGTCILLYRAYCAVFGSQVSLPGSYEELIRSTAEILNTEGSAALCRRSLLVLYGPNSAAAAFDLESKINEAGLGDIQITDYRNFAHGRHAGLLAKSGHSSVIAFISKEDKEIGESTLKLIPQSIPRIAIRFPLSGPEAAISAVAAGLHVVDIRAKMLGVDPGKPHVPQFGRKLYHLNAWKAKPVTNRMRIAIKRKMAVSFGESASAEEWSRECKRFVDLLRSTAFDGVVLDYDGTLCDPRYRFESLPQNIAKELERLLSQGALLGIRHWTRKISKESVARQS
jgi:hypothetical protein